MKLSSDAMTIMVGLLGDMAVMQRKVEAGQGATCGVDVLEGPDGEVRVSFAATLDPGFKVMPAPPADEPIQVRNGLSTYPFTGVT